MKQPNFTQEDIDAYKSGEVSTKDLSEKYGIIIMTVYQRLCRLFTAEERLAARILWKQKHPRIKVEREPKCRYCGAGEEKKLYVGVVKRTGYKFYTCQDCGRASQRKIAEKRHHILKHFHLTHYGKSEQCAHTPVSLCRTCGEPTLLPGVQDGHGAGDSIPGEVRL